MKTNQLFNSVSLAVALLCFSCGEQRTESKEDSIKTGDSVTKVLATVIPVLDFFNKKCPLPFAVDTTLLFHLENFDSLGTNEVKALTGNWFKHDLVAGASYDIETFYKIDSVKAVGKYKEYCDSLQIGNTKYANAYAICKLQADTNTAILVWTLVSSSYEACPYSETKTVYFTIVYGGAITQTFELGEYGTYADAPVSMVRTLSGKMNTDLSFIINVYQEGDEDMDLPTIEVTKEHYEFAIKEGKISLMMEKKEAPKKVKRKINSNR